MGVLTGREGELLALALSTLVCLGRLSRTGLGGGQLSLKLANLVLQLSHGSLASLGSSVLSISQTALKLSELVVKGLLGRGLAGSMVLLSTELIGQASSINHGINLSLDGVDGSLQSALGGHVAAIDDLHVVDGTAAITNLHLQLALGTLSAVQQSLALLKLSRTHVLCVDT